MTKARTASKKKASHKNKNHTIAAHIFLAPVKNNIVSAKKKSKKKKTNSKGGKK
jgi:hypothetical protein